MIYAMTLTWTAQMPAIAFVIVRDPAASVHVIAAKASLGAIWSARLAVSGLYVWKRSKDKEVAAGRPAEGFAALGRALGNAFRGKK